MKKANHPVSGTLDVIVEHGVSDNTIVTIERKTAGREETVYCTVEETRKLYEVLDDYYGDDNE